MASTFTTNLGLNKPGTTDTGWDSPLRADLDLLDGQSALAMFGVRQAEYPSASLNVEVASGTYRKGDGTIGTYAGIASQALGASATNYLYLTDAGVLTVNTSGFPAAGNYVPIATVATGSSTIGTITDARRPFISFGGHVHWGVGTPTIAAGAGAGTGPTIALSGTASDQAGVVSLTTGTTPSVSSVVATVTFGMAFSSAPRAVILTPAGGAAAALSGNAAVYADLAGVGTASFTLNVGSSALAATTTYKWYYEVIG